mgnify:CR=1 FL=1
MAGHSQYKNIMHRKGRQDRVRSKIFSKLGREITVAAKNGLPDPDANSRLRLAIQNARAENMPKDTIERAIKKAVLHRKNALFYKTMNGARAGDLFMSLIHTCELNGVNSFDYLVALLRNPKAVAESPAEWMPWAFQAAGG